MTIQIDKHFLKYIIELLKKQERFLLNQEFYKDEDEGQEIFLCRSSLGLLEKI